MKNILSFVFDALDRVQRERDRRAAFEQLDAHTLRDIGLEQEAERARRRAARDRMHFGVYY
jgi:uncharacterized protein YjiS (DUF1127 family)